MSEGLPVPINLPVIQPESTKKRRGRKPKPVFDHATRQLVRDMATWGVPLKSMRLHVRDPNTGEPVSQAVLTEHFGREIEEGTAFGDAMLAQNLWAQANGREAVYGVDSAGKRIKLSSEIRPQPGPAIFLSKVRLGYRETSVVEHKNFNMAIFHEVKDELRKLSADDLAEIRQDWQTKLRRKEAVAGEGGTAQGRNRDGD
jgi:hypothetical protein